MRHISGEDRQQGSLLPPSLEDFIPADHPVRVIDAWVDKLDLAALDFDKAVPKETGRKPYHPGDLLKLYVYGYLNQVTTSRRLERECQRNLEVLWLLGRLAPDFKTIADFRKDNGAAIVQACRAFVQFCRQAGLLSSRLVAIDGSKFKAASSKDRALTRRQLERDRAQIEQQITRYLARLDEADASAVEVELAQEKVQAALQRLERLERYEQAMDVGGRDQHCATEPEARLLRSSRDGTVLGYNVQAAVEADSGLIVHHAVTDESGDSRMLQPMAEAAQTELGAEELTVLADTGYSNGEQQAACEAGGITPVVPRRMVPYGDKSLYQKSDFDYDRERNEYHCPAGEVLRYFGDNKRRKLHLYRRSGCAQCPLQPACAKADTRTVTRHFYEDAFERSEARLKADPSLRTRRMTIAERPFATLKQAMSLRRFVCRGIAGAQTEMAIAVMGYNLKRAIGRIGVPRMLALLA